eukprot:5507976-Pleurochrysis_carterae.AAC.1
MLAACTNTWHLARASSPYGHLSPTIGIARPTSLSAPHNPEPCHLVCALNMGPLTVCATGEHSVAADIRLTSPTCMIAGLYLCEHGHWAASLDLAQLAVDPELRSKMREHVRLTKYASLATQIGVNDREVKNNTYGQRRRKCTATVGEEADTRNWGERGGEQARCNLVRWQITEDGRRKQGIGMQLSKGATVNITGRTV